MISTVATLSEWLGLEQTLHTELDLTEAIRIGLPATALTEVARRGHIDLSVLYRIVGSRRTLGRRKERLTRDESDRLLRVARILAMAVDTFDNEEKALKWIQRSNRALGGRTPMELLDTESGARLVEQTLGRIAYGVFS